MSDNRRFAAILIGVVAMLILLALSWQWWQETKREQIEALSSRRATRGEFEDQIGLPDKIQTWNGEECWWYHLDRNPILFICFEPKTGYFLRGPGHMWIH